MYGCVATFQPIGTRLAPLNSKCPMLLVPALSSSCAAALSSTPKSTRAKLMAFIVVCSRRLDEIAAMVVGNQLHRHPGGRELIVKVLADQRQRIRLALPDLHPFVDGRNGKLRFLLQPEVELVAKLYQSHRAAEVEVERLIVGVEAIERDVRPKIGLHALRHQIGRCRGRQRLVPGDDELGADQSGKSDRDECT